MRDTFMQRFTSNWSVEARQKFRREPTIIRHNYHEHPLFSDMALAALIERHPRELIDFCTMGDDATDHDSWRAGNPGALTGMQLIDAVRRGKLWVNLRHAMDLDEEYRPIFDAMLGDMKRANPDFRPLGCEAGILISSPAAQVFLHSDVSETMLWHMRGVKRFRAYPPRYPYLNTDDVEAVLHHDQTEDIPFKPEWDRDAFTADLHPGMAINWPLHGPHRVENQSGVNVSVAFEMVTPLSRQKNAILYANGVLRRKFGMTPSSISPDGIGAVAKLALAAAVKLQERIFGRAPRVMPKSQQTFDIDPAAPEGFIDRLVA